MSDFLKPYAQKKVSAVNPFETCGNFRFPQVSFNHSAESLHCVLNPPAGSAKSKKFIKRLAIKINFSYDSRY
jgi:hypothetical protein